MALDFEKYDYELFQDWQQNPVKSSFISELEKRAEEEKKALPKLLSNGDLKKDGIWKTDKAFIISFVKKIFLNLL